MHARLTQIKHKLLINNLLYEMQWSPERTNEILGLEPECREQMQRLESMLGKSVSTQKMPTLLLLSMIMFSKLDRVQG